MFEKIDPCYISGLVACLQERREISRVVREIQEIFQPLLCNLPDGWLSLEDHVIGSLVKLATMDDHDRIHFEVEIMSEPSVEVMFKVGRVNPERYSNMLSGELCYLKTLGELQFSPDGIKFFLTLPRVPQEGPRFLIDSDALLGMVDPPEGWRVQKMRISGGLASAVQRIKELKRCAAVILRPAGVEERLVALIVESLVDAASKVPGSFYVTLEDSIPGGIEISLTKFVESFQELPVGRKVFSEMLGLYEETRCILEVSDCSGFWELKFQEKREK